MKKINFRRYSKVVNTQPLIDGIIPTLTAIKKGIRFNVVAQDGHVLSEKEWSDVIGDNMLVFGNKSKQKSPYNIKDLKFVSVDEDNQKTCKGVT